MLAGALMLEGPMLAVGGGRGTDALGAGTTACGTGSMMIVRPLLAKLAISGTVAATTNSAAPLFSRKVASGMILLSKVSACEPGATTASWLNAMRSFPGSVAIIGLTGAVKFITNFGGVVLLTWAVKCTATLPTNKRREFWLNVTGPPRMRGRSVPRHESGTRPRWLSR